jgi:hypothetical protein
MVADEPSILARIGSLFEGVHDLAMILVSFKYFEPFS